MCISNFPHLTTPSVWTHNLFIKWIMSILLRVVLGQAQEPNTRKNTHGTCSVNFESHTKLLNPFLMNLTSLLSDSTRASGAQVGHS